jgi:hypothetical protein
MRYIILLFSFMMLCIGNHLFGQELTDTIESKKTSLGQSYYLGNERLTLKRLTEITVPNALAHNEIKQAQICNVFGCVFGIVGGACIGYPLGVLIGGGKPNWIIAGVGAGCLLIGIPIAIVGDKHVAKGVALYNKGIQQASVTTIHFRLGFNPTGVSMVMTF